MRTAKPPSPPSERRRVRTRRLTVPGDTTSLAGVCAFVEAAADAGGFDERTSHACQLAVCEAVENVIQHGYRGERGTILLRARSGSGSLTVEIVDDAPAFDPTRYPVDPRASLRDARVGGRGLLMIRRVMDDISYERRGRQNILRLTKNRVFTGV
ncbi:MAG TPA: ATP-binding protein [Anaerolineales bacterium]|nr:ATP-binding protein [Anaerolineales bacterium]